MVTRVASQADAAAIRGVHFHAAAVGAEIVARLIIASPMNATASGGTSTHWSFASDPTTIRLRVMPWRTVSQALWVLEVLTLPDLSLDLRHLRYVLAVVEQGSFRRAALSLDLPQSTISRRVQMVSAVLTAPSSITCEVADSDL
ncbi:MAG: LysR family transcriptional regulator [Xanthobacteraceae bacterium]